MHHRPDVSSQRSVVYVADCRIGCFSRYCSGRTSPNINVAALNWVILRRLSVPFVLPNFIDICQMGAPVGRKTSKIAHQIFKIKRIFKFVPSPTDHMGHIGKVLHRCTTAFLPLYRSIKICIQILLHLSDMVHTK